MEVQAIIEAVQNIFIGADEHNWALTRSSFADEVLLDYTSMTGGEPAKLAADKIIDDWKGFLPKFKATHHQLGNFTVERQGGDLASVFFYGTASHYFPNDSGANLWTVVGTYEAELELHDGWKVTALRFNLKFMDGNLNLPKLI